MVLAVIMDEQLRLLEDGNYKELAKLDHEALVEVLERANRTERPVPESTPPASPPDKTSAPVQIGIRASALFDGYRPAPNIIARSSAFAVVGRGKRDSVKNLEIETYGDKTSITYSGERLSQVDFDIWTRLLEMQVREGTDELEFSGYSFLKSVGRGKSTRDYKTLKESLSRLSDGIFRIDCEYGKFMGRLLVQYESDSSGYRAYLNPSMRGLLHSDNCITYLPSDIRSELRGDLSKWLHAFISTHRANPLRSKVENIRKWCGSKTKELYRFRQMLRRSCEELVEAGVVNRYDVDDHDVLYVYAR